MGLLLLEEQSQSTSTSQNFGSGSASGLPFLRHPLGLKSQSDGSNNKPRMTMIHYFLVEGGNIVFNDFINENTDTVMESLVAHLGVFYPSTYRH